MTRLVAVLLVVWMALPVGAHEVRPAYLELHEEATGDYRVLWKTPMRGDQRLALSPEFSGPTDRVVPVAGRATGGAAVQTWRMRFAEPLRGQTVRVAGLEGTMTDALVHARFADGTSWTHRLTPAQPSAQIPVRETGLVTAGVYLKLGIEHILLGIDHLLFVFALLLITRGTWKLVKAITAFTVAHSITLGMATLGWVHAPSPPVEALIALSIAFLAAEIVRGGRGREGLTYRSPWVVAFIFGLVHGFGFAGALREIGLPQGQIPLALLSFNVGVELGQLLFVAIVLSTFASLRRLRLPLPASAGLAASYAIGSVAMFWMMDRVGGFWS